MDGEDLSVYLSGQRLYGDSLDAAELERWWRDEEDAYAALGAGDRERYRYGYHALNRRHGFRHLPDRRYERALGLGSAYGDEFLPIAGQIGQLTVVESCEAFHSDRVHGVPATYVKPEPSGVLPFDDASFDLISCLNVLHHVANVSFVVSELARCLAPGGFALIHEPVVSMGDWRVRRPSLTRHERGIPAPIYRRILKDAGFTVVNEAFCLFPPIPRFYDAIGRAAYNGRVATWLDSWICGLLAWNLRYHRTRLFERFSPTCIYSVLTRS